MNWQTPEAWTETHRELMLQVGTTIHRDPDSVQKFVNEKLKLKGATVYTLGAISTDRLDVLGVRVQMIDAPDGSEIKLTEKRVYDYHGLPLVVHKWVQA